MTIDHRATCTWGDGPDVLVLVEGRSAWPPVVHADKGNGVSFGLSRREAYHLARQLLEAAEECWKLEEDYARDQIRDLKKELEKR